MGIFKSTDGGTTWTQLGGRPAEHPPGEHRDRRRRIRTLYATIAPLDAGRSASTSPPTPARTGSRRFASPGAPAGLTRGPRPLVRIGGGDLPTVTVDPKDPQVVYTRVHA